MAEKASLERSTRLECPKQLAARGASICRLIPRTSCRPSGRTSCERLISFLVLLLKCTALAASCFLPSTICLDPQGMWTILRRYRPIALPNWRVLPAKAPLSTGSTDFIFSTSRSLMFQKTTPSGWRNYFRASSSGFVSLQWKCTISFSPNWFETAQLTLKMPSFSPGSPIPTPGVTHSEAVPPQNTLTCGFLQVHPLRAAQAFVALENFSIALQAEHGLDRTATEGMRQHPPPIAKHEQRIVRNHRRDVPRLHPAFSAPSLILDFLGRQVLRGDHRRRAVVLFQALDHD